MTVKNIISQEEIKVPCYGKHHGFYGWLIATYDKRVVFVYHVNDETEMDDVTNYYEKI